MKYAPYNLTDPKTITLPGKVRPAWEQFRKVYDTLPDAVKEAYYRDFLAVVSKLDVAPWWRTHPMPAFQYPATPEQLREIGKIVEDNVQAFLYETMGMNLDKARIKDLQKKGILAKDVTRIDFPANTFSFGRVMDLIEQGIDYHDARRMASRNPITEIEKVAIEHLRERSCNAVTGMANAYEGKIKDVIIEKNHQFLREMISEGKEKIMTDHEIASAIGHATGDWSRDLFRICYTEGHTGQQYAVAMDLQKKFGTHPVTGKPKRIKVAKMPEKDACRYCFELYTHPDGSLKMFYLDDMMNNPLTNEPYIDSLGQTIKRYASRIGDAVRGWLAVIGATHPYCRCRLVKFYESLFDRKFIEAEIKEGRAKEQELNAVNKWKEARDKAFGKK